MEDLTIVVIMKTEDITMLKIIKSGKPSNKTPKILMIVMNETLL